MSEKRHSGFIRYDKVRQFIDFGGIRIEDNIFVKAEGHQIIGDPVPKTIDDIEKIMAG